MARFAGSQAPTIPNFGRSSQVSGVTPMPMRTAGVTSNAGSAADAVSVGNIFGSLRKNSVDYQSLSTKAAENRQAEKLAGWKAEGDMTIAGINAATDVYIGEQEKKAYDKQAGAAKTGGFLSAFGSIASAALPLAFMSDETTKHTINSIDDALATLRELKPVTFYYKEEYSDEPNRMHHGFIAQEYQKVMPDATYYDKELDKLKIDTNDLIALLVRANQQLESRVTRLEAKQALAAV